VTLQDGWDRPQDDPLDERGDPGATDVVEPVAAPAPPPNTLPSNASFSERYRGTEWGIPTAPQPATVAATPTARGGAVVVGGGILALTAVAALALFMFQGRGAEPALPAGAVRLPEASAVATEKPGRVTKTSVVNAFVKRVNAKNFAYTVEFSAAFTATEYNSYEVASMSGAMDIRSQDFSGQWRIHIINGQNAEVAMVFKGKNGYVRLPEEGWECAGKGPRPNVNAFAGLTAARDLQYEGIKTKNGARLHQLRATKPRAINPWVLQDSEWAKATVKGVIYDVYVNDSGVPVVSTFTARIRVPDGVAKTEIKIVADYRFRNVGRPVDIKAPADVCEGQVPA
jgi:hypothetical protein